MNCPSVGRRHLPRASLKTRARRLKSGTTPLTRASPAKNLMKLASFARPGQPLDAEAVELALQFKPTN